MDTQLTPDNAAVSLFTTETPYFTGGAIKSIGINGDGKIGGYLVVWGSANKTDSGGEWFTPDTDLALDAYAQRPVLYHHGLSDIKTTVIGQIISLKEDVTGVYAEAILDVNHEDPQIRTYARSAYDMVCAGKLGWSSGSAPNLVEVEPNGHIKRWMIVEGSLTPTPAEPHRTSVSAIKSAISKLENFELETPKELSAKGELWVKLETNVIDSKLSVKSNRKPSVKMTMMDVYTEAGLSPEQIVALLGKMEEAGLSASPVAVADEVDSDATMAIGDVAAATPPAADPPVMAKAQPAPVQPAGLTKQEVKGMIETAMKSAPARTAVPGLTTADPSKSYQNDIEVFSPTHDLSAADLSFMMDMRRLYANKTAQPYTPEIKMFREMTEKAQKAIKAGEIDLGFDYDAKVSKNNRVLAVKSNELDNTGVAGAAGNWVPELWSAQLWRRFRVPDRTIGQFQVVEMPSATYDLPVEDTDPTVYYVPETTDNAQLSLASGAAIPSSVVGAGKVQLIAKKLALRVGFSTEMMEDSIIPFIPQLRDQALITMQNATENVVINGDTTNSSSNINGNPGAATDKFLAFNGMRYLGLITNTAVSTNAAGATPTLQMIRQARFKLISTLNTYALDPANLVIIVDQYTYGKMLNIDELLAWYNNGRDSTVNTGVLPNIDGITVIPSAQLPLTDTTGVVNATAGLNIYGTAIIAAKSAWKVGYRRQVTSSLDYLPYYDSYQLTNTIRLAFKNKDTIANAVIYGLATQ